MRPLVIVRPQPGADATAASARALGVETIVMPLFAVEPVDWQAPDPADFDGLLLTSANALRHGGPGLENLSALPAYCVGEATAAAARELGLAVAGTGDRGVDALLNRLPEGQRLLHLCGIDRREPQHERQAIEAVPVYAARELPVPGGLNRVKGAVVALHSPRAAATLSSRAFEAGLARETVAIAAISEAAALASGDGWEHVEWAAEPSDSALLALAAELCNNRR